MVFKGKDDFWLLELGKSKPLKEFQAQQHVSFGGVGNVDFARLFSDVFCLVWFDCAGACKTCLSDYLFFLFLFILLPPAPSSSHWTNLSSSDFSKWILLTGFNFFTCSQLLYMTHQMNNYFDLFSTFINGIE